MKKSTLTLALATALFTSMTLLNCSKKEEPAPATAASTNTVAKGKCKITATISGAATAQFTSNDMLSTTNKSSYIMLSSSNMAMEQFIIMMPLNTAVGSYKADDSDISKFTYSNGSTGWTSGTVGAIVSYSVTKSTAEDIEGNFEGTLGEDDKKSKINVKGTFIAKY